MNGKLATGCSRHRAGLCPCSTKVKRHAERQLPNSHPLLEEIPAVSLWSCPEVPRLVLGIALLFGESRTCLVREGDSPTLPQLQEASRASGEDWGSHPGPAELCSGSWGAGVSRREPIPADAAGCSEPRRPSPLLGCHSQVLSWSSLVLLRGKLISSGKTPC